MTRSDLHGRAGFEAFVTSLPAVTTNAQWEALVAKVGGKVFAMLGDDAGHRPGAIVFKVTEIAFVFAGIGALFALLGAGLSIFWFGRVV